MVKYIYIDYNELVVLEKEKPTKRDREALEYISERKDYKILLSSLHLVEATGRIEKKDATSIGRFMESLKPYWLRDKINVQRSEVKVEFYKELYSYVINVEAIYPSFSQLVEDFGISYKDYTPSDFISGCKQNPALMKPINDAIGRYLDCWDDIQTAQAKGRRIRKVDKTEIARCYIRRHLPIYDPQGISIRPAEKDDFIHQVDLRKLIRYPSIYTELLFSDFKRLDCRRQPRRTDLADHQHLIPGLTYADAFVTRDGYLRDGARYVKGKARIPLAEIYDSLASFVEAE